MIIFENEFYVVHYRGGSSSFVLVTFTGIRAPEVLDGTYFAKRPCDNLDITVVGMVAKTNNWYREQSIYDALAKARFYTDGYDEVYLYGISSGAYAAIKYSGLLKASYTVAMAPQYSLDRSERPGEPTEFDAYYCEYMKSMGIRREDTSGKIYLVRDPACRDDNIHADWIACNVDDLSILPMFHTGHVVSHHVKGTTNLSKILSSIKSSSTLFKALSDARRQNAENQKNIMASAARKHPQLTLRALNSYRCRSSGGYNSFTKNRPLVKVLLLYLLKAGRTISAGSLLCSSLYGLAGRQTLPVQAKLLYFTSFGEIVTYDPVMRLFSSTENLFPRNGFQYALFSWTPESKLGFGFCAIDGLYQPVEDQEWNEISVEARHGFQHLMVGGRYLSAQPHGEIHTDRLVPDLWERFYPLPLENITTIDHCPKGVAVTMRSHLGTTRIVAAAGGQNSIHNGSDYTFLENWTLEGDFNHIRLIYMVDSSDTDLKIAAVAIASTSRLVNNPVDVDGHAAPLVPVTFNRQGRPEEFAEPTLEQAHEREGHVLAGMDLPGIPDLAPGEVAMVPRLYFSDWTPLGSVQRVDGGPGRLLHIRTAIPHRGSMRGIATSDDGRSTGADPFPLTQRSYQTCFIRGQFLTNERIVPELNSVPAPAQGRGLLYGIQLISREPGATIQMVGDSIGAGYGSMTNNTGFAQIAASFLSRPSLPVHFLQSATYGQPSSGFFDAAKQDLEIANVSVAIIQTWSGNDVDPQMTGEEARKAADAAWRGALDYGRLVARRGGVPIYLSAVPQSPKCVTSEQEAARLSSVIRCRELAATGSFTIDLNGELGDGGTRVNYAPRFLCDGLHPNQVGHDHIAALLAPILTSILELTAERGPDAAILPAA